MGACAGFVRGPRTLNIVRMPRERRIGCTRRIAGCINGAKRKTNPVARRQRTASPGASAVGTPSASNTSADPQRLVRLRLPCLAIFAPAAAAISATAVEILNVPLASPPVPQVSTREARSSSLNGKVTAVARMASAKPVNSSAVTRRAASAVRNSAIYTSGNKFWVSSRMVCIAARACWRLSVACCSVRRNNTFVRSAIESCSRNSLFRRCAGLLAPASSDSIECSLCFVFLVRRRRFTVPSGPATRLTIRVTL